MIQYERVYVSARIRLLQGSRRLLGCCAPSDQDGNKNQKKKISHKRSLATRTH
jgi:hypothetical protein